MLENLIKELQETGASNEEIAYKCRLSSSQVANLMSGRTTNPTLNTINVIRKFIDDKKKGDIE